MLSKQKKSSYHEKVIKTASNITQNYMNIWLI